MTRRETAAADRHLAHTVDAMPTPGARRRIAAHGVFFSAATIHAMLVLPASVLAMTGIAAIPSLATPAGHAQEMLFGFALAVVAGHQLGPLAPSRLLLLGGLWGTARAAFLLVPHTPLPGIANVAFATLLAVHVVPRLAGAAKKWRNRALPVALAAICGCAIALQILHAAGAMAMERRVLTLAVLLFALLMLFMGGRLIAPAIAGQFHRQGEALDARVQPRLEAGLIVAMAIACGAMAWGTEPWSAMVCASSTAVAGLLAAARLFRWRPWALRGRPDLLCLAAGYAWLAVGLLAIAGALAVGAYLTVAVHLVTVGSLGTLTLNVMALTVMLKARRDPARTRIPVWGTLFIGAAAVTRALAGSGMVEPRMGLPASALCWSAGFAALAVLLVRAVRRVA